MLGKILILSLHCPCCLSIQFSAFLIHTVLPKMGIILVVILAFRILTFGVLFFQNGDIWGDFKCQWFRLWALGFCCSGLCLQDYGWQHKHCQYMVASQHACVWVRPMSSLHVLDAHHCGLRKNQFRVHRTLLFPALKMASLVIWQIQTFPPSPGF